MSTFFISYLEILLLIGIFLIFGALVAYRFRRYQRKEEGKADQILKSIVVFGIAVLVFAFVQFYIVAKSITLP